MDYTGQRRAQAGGEIGANGEWYEGGKFIATRDNPKRSPPPPPSAEELMRRAEFKAREDARMTAFTAWLGQRITQFSDLLKFLESFPQDDFYSSLARQIREQGSLSIKQSRYAVKFFMGRRVKKNSSAWDDLDYALTERFDWRA